MHCDPATVHIQNACEILPAEEVKKGRGSAVSDTRIAFGRDGLNEIEVKPVL